MREIIPRFLHLNDKTSSEHPRVLPSLLKNRNGIWRFFIKFGGRFRGLRQLGDRLRETFGEHTIFDYRSARTYGRKRNYVVFDVEKSKHRFGFRVGELAPCSWGRCHKFNRGCE
jgi:hypothetical protein